MWNVPVLIFEDEDEEALKAEFIRLSALYPTYQPGEIAQVVFKGLRDPILRSQQAAEAWSTDLEVKDRIRQARLNGGVEPKPVSSKDERLRKLEAIADDEKAPLKERLAAHRLIAEMNGEVIKAVDKTTKDVSKRLPTIVYAQYAGG